MTTGVVGKALVNVTACHFAAFVCSISTVPDSYFGAARAMPTPIHAHTRSETIRRMGRDAFIESARIFSRPWKHRYGRRTVQRCLGNEAEIFCGCTRLRPR